MRPAEAVRFAGRVAVLGTIAWTTIATALGAEPKPDFIFKNRNRDASVYLDGQIKKDGALATDCLGDGKKWFLSAADDGPVHQPKPKPLCALPRRGHPV